MTLNFDMENRRNYYRVLHVQPDAPSEVIKATYRTLMQNLKMHPDLGGDTWNAALVNEAYAVLRDPLKRALYDRSAFKNLCQRQPEVRVDDVPTPNYERGHCLFCKSMFLTVPGRATSELCPECRSPLHRMDSPETEITLRRIAARIADSFEITYYTYWPQLPQKGIAKDFSPTGIAFAASDHFFIGQVIKIESSQLSAVAQVKNHEAISTVSTDVRVGLKFMAVSFSLPRGTFIGVTV
jgi:curved DNA-binding protein CbpA